MVKKKIIVLCTGNSCRSQMAQGYLEHFGGTWVQVFSAGIDPKPIHPYAIKVMREDGISIMHHTSNHIDEYKDLQFDYIITVCDNANEQCPDYPVKEERFHKNFPDPAKAIGTEEEILNEFRRVRAMIKEYCFDFIRDVIKDTINEKTNN